MKDLTGQRFGRLVVEKYGYLSTYSGEKVHYWHCKCDCGNEVDVRANCLTCGFTKSCGCLRSELSSERAKKRNHENSVKITLNDETHDMYEWAEITGISVHTIYKRTKSGWSPEKILSTKKWSGGGRNHWPREKLKSFSVNGENHTIKEWSDITGLSYQTIYSRLKRGFDPEDAISKKLY